MKKDNLKERIQDCLLALDFETDRMSSGGNQCYRELKNIVIDLYEDNYKMLKKIKEYELENVQSNEEKLR